MSHYTDDMAKSKKTPKTTKTTKKPFDGQTFFQFRTTNETAEAIRAEAKRRGMSVATLARQVVLSFVQRLNPTAVVIDPRGKNPPARLALQFVGNIGSGDAKRNYRVKDSPMPDGKGLPWWTGPATVFVLDTDAWALARSFFDFNSKRYDIVLERAAD
jgi:hypothetical protein